VRDADPEIGRLRNHGFIGLPPGGNGLGAEARVLLVGHAGNDDAARAAAIRGGPRGSRRHHRGNAALHVLRATAVEPAVPDLRRERGGHALHADGVGVAAQHSGRPAGFAFSDTHDVPAAGRYLVDMHIKVLAAQPVADERGNLALAGAASHQRGVHRIDRDEIPEQRDGGIHWVRESALGAQGLHGYFQSAMKTLVSPGF